jgi:hypothetical protein
MARARTKPRAGEADTRSVAQVMADRARAVSGCCNRFADNQGCDCLSAAQAREAAALEAAGRATPPDGRYPEGPADGLCTCMLFALAAFSDRKIYDSKAGAMVSWKAWFCEELRKAGYGYLPQARIMRF